jgi:cytochrome P450
VQTWLNKLASNRRRTGQDLLLVEPDDQLRRADRRPREDAMAAAAELLGYAMTMTSERRACPADDIVTKLISAEIDGQHRPTTSSAS